jgi:polysaccharide pyruvyl transferase WcaK-like protein
MKNKIKVAHLASFTGNLGDIANHRGFREWFANTLDVEIDWSEFEIRDFYRQTSSFDQNLAIAWNLYDLVVIGGGNYLELWPENSRTGCSIDLPPELLSMISVPVYFNALGLDDGQGVSKSARENFSNFFNYVLTNKNCLVSLRNDGSRETLESVFPEFKNKKYYVTPDHGFFALQKNFYRQEVRVKERTVIGINLAQDMPGLRFKESKSEFLKHFSNVLQEIEFDKLIFFPHIFSDVGIIYELLDVLPDDIRRSKCSIAPYGCRQEDVETLFNYYTSLDLMLAMRFHANILPISIGIPTVGISTYPQISKLFKELELDDWVENIHEFGWSKRLIAKVNRYYNEPERAVFDFAKVQPEIVRQRAAFSSSMREWFESCGVSAERVSGDQIEK